MDKSVWENMDEIDDVDDWDDPDFVDVTEEDENFAKDMFDVIQGLIDSEEGKDLTEEFMSDRGATVHFERHCLGHHRNERRSQRTNVYYDFRDVSQYKERERTIDSVARDSGRHKNVVAFPSMLLRTEIEEGFRKLFEGNQYLVFSQECGFHNNMGRVRLVIHSFASDVTRNYSSGNTVDLVIYGNNGKAVTMYPIDANYFENKINSIIRRYHDDNIEPFHINH